MLKKIRVGVIGAGFAAHARTIALNKIGKNRAEVIGVFDSNKNNSSKFADEFSIASYSSFDNLLGDSKIDTIAICIPNKFHFNTAIKALNSKKNIICEYPIVIESYSHAKKLFDIANKKNLFIHVGQTMNFDADLQVVLKNRNILGKLCMGYKYVTFGKPGTWFIESGFNNGYQNLGEWYVKNNLTGGWILAACYHGIQILRKVFGEIKTVSSIDTTTSSVSSGSVLLGHINNASSVVQWGLGIEGKNFNLFIATGSKGSIMVEDEKFELKTAEIKDSGVLQYIDTFFEDSKLLFDKLDGKINIDNENTDMLKNLKISFLAQKAAIEKKCLKVLF